MSQRIAKKRTSPVRAPGNGMRVAPALPAEHPLEMKARLRIEAAEARWKRVREMVLVGTAVFVIVNVCLMSTILICAPSTSSDKQAGMFMLSQIVSILLGAVLGKAVKLKR